MMQSGVSPKYEAGARASVTLSLDTSTSECRLYINDAVFIWEAARQLAHGLLVFIEQSLSQEGYVFNDITGLVIFRGPGSFTGLRIGMAVFDTIAESQHTPIVGETGSNWREVGMARLERGENDRIVLPEYGGDAHITAPKK